ncbi:MAG TPA: SGNH/GDSL hydrolase family protein [Bacteroidota bacterium]|nr:SGNH/GDSL hydrolase family protein [Bacteroidota bacterium]
MKRSGVVVLLLGVLLNQWVLSALYPADGMHLFRLLEKSQGSWGLASCLLIWACDLALVLFGGVMIRYQRDRRKAVQVTVTVMLVFVVLSGALEGAARLLTREGIFSPFIQLRPYNKMELKVALKGVAPFARNTTDKWGFRGDDPPADWDDYLTIVAIGGSTTQCYYLDDSKTWPYLLQVKLRKAGVKAWVGNAGISGHSSRAHVLFVRDILPRVKPKIAIILCGINDLWYSLQEKASKVDYSPETVGWKNKLLGYSRLVQVLYLWKIILWDHVVVLEKGGNDNFVPRPIGKELILSSDLSETLPSLLPYKQNLHIMIKELRKQNIRPIFLTQPVLFDTTAPWKVIVGADFSYGGKKGEISAATDAELLSCFNNTLASVCREEHAELFDLAGRIPHSDLYFYDTMHFTELGADTVSSLIAAYMVSHPR